ncbi:MAG: hypothetical protein ABIQ16_21305 [Polyangiaceae bacterium]
MLAQADSPRWLRVARSPWAFLVAALLLGALATHAVLGATGGTPAVPLDDSYIHFQFARSFAEGHAFVFSPHTAPVPGATSLLWPLLLAVPRLIGVQGSAIIWWAWGFGFVALGLLAFETARAAERITSRRVAWLSGVLTLAFSANTWFAASGMEVVPLAWLLMRSARRSAEWLEGDRERLWELVLLAFCAPLMRPEGALASVMIAYTLLVSGGAARFWGLLALSAIGAPPAIYFAFTGHATQTTTLVKWLPFNPYLTFSGVFERVLENVRVLFATLLDGQLWSAAYIPEHSKVIAWLALPGLFLAGQIRQRTPRALLLVALGLGILLPTSYDSFLWNRLRYLWPFAGPWWVGLVALADQLGDVAALWKPRVGLIRYVICAALIGALASKFPFALDDLATSSSAISRQQVELGTWAKERLPPSARIGVNDTGAVGYFSEHAIFDVVGLTTLGEARYWSAGAGSRFEHYERLPRAALPTHFIVYPGWFAIPELLGPCLIERTVYATILGGTTMVGCVADYSRLGSGERPALPQFWQAVPRDVLDVADLESEASHGYVVLPATQADDVVLSNGILVDGARRNRSRDSFQLDVESGGRLVTRLGCAEPLIVTVRVGGHIVDSWTVQRPDFEDHAIRLPDDVPRGPSAVEVSGEGGRFSAAHYWSYGASQ